ncbi:MAG: MgtC/SapB family protein [Acidobacteria bacterium]|nr:MgtC/SapB family protein [Acidobacteriota bacterium]
MDLSVHIFYRLILAAFLGGTVGLERELRKKPAGIRTNMFICMGSALFTILSYEISERFVGDHTRIAAQIIPGIGFIGAGAILRDRGSVVGLTTAATIFVVASVGMAVGAGLLLTGVWTALLMLIILRLFGWIESRFIQTSHLMTFRVTTAVIENVMRPTHETLREMNVQMEHFQVYRIGQDFLMEFDAEVTEPQKTQVLEKLASLDAKCEVAPLHGPRE